MQSANDLPMLITCLSSELFEDLEGIQDAYAIFFTEFSIPITDGCQEKD